MQILLHLRLFLCVSKNSKQEHPRKLTKRKNRKTHVKEKGNLSSVWLSCAGTKRAKFLFRKSARPSVPFNAFYTDSKGDIHRTFTQRYRNHMCSFKKERCKHATEPSKHIWSLKDKKISFNIKWRKIKQARSYSNVTKKCNLCLWENFVNRKVNAPAINFVVR